MNLKKTLILGLSLLWSVSAQADGRAIGVRSTRDADFKVHVSISSGVENERKKNITVEQAAGILRDAKGWGSSVWVGIVAHGVPSQDYPPLLEEIVKETVTWLSDGRYPDATFGHFFFKTGEGASASPSRMIPTGRKVSDHRPVVRAW